MGTRVQRHQVRLPEWARVEKDGQPPRVLGSTFREGQSIRQYDEAMRIQKEKCVLAHTRHICYRYEPALVFSGDRKILLLL